MKNNLSIFTHNWGTKLIALILAIVVFYWVRSSIRGSGNAGSPAHSFMKGSSNAASDIR